MTGSWDCHVQRVQAGKQCGCVDPRGPRNRSSAMERQLRLHLLVRVPDSRGQDEKTLIARARRSRRGVTHEQMLGDRPSPGFRGAHRVLLHRRGGHPRHQALARLVQVGIGS